MNSNKTNDIHRKSLLSSVDALLTAQHEYIEGEIVTANYRGLTLRFHYTEKSTDQCFYALLKAEYLQKHLLKRLLFKLLHRRTNQTSFDIENPKEWKKAVRAALDRMPLNKPGQ